MSAQLIAGPGVECIDCGEIFSVTEAERQSETCPRCGEYAPGVEISDCPNGGDCDAEAHHFGNGMHIKDVA